MNNYNFTSMNEDDIKNVFPSYYEYFNHIYGTSLFTDLCRKRITKGEYKSKTLAVFDPAYGQAKEAMAKSENGDIKIVIMRTAEGQDIGYFRIRFLNIEGVNIACVAELVLPTELEGNRADSLKEMISAIETQVATDCLDTDRLDFEVGVNDLEMQIALVEAGCIPLPGQDDSPKLTFMYEKQLRKQKATR